MGPLLGNVCSGTIVEEIEAAICDEPGLCPDFERAKIALVAMLDEAGVDVYLQTVVVNVQKEGEHLKSVRTQGKFGVIDFEADAFIDATGDGDLAVLSGCPWESRRQEDGLVQPVTLMFVIDGIDPEQQRRFYAKPVQLQPRWIRQKSVNICWSVVFVWTKKVNKTAVEEREGYNET